MIVVMSFWCFVILMTLFVRLAVIAGKKQGKDKAAIKQHLRDEFLSMFLLSVFWPLGFLCILIILFRMWRLPGGALDDIVENVYGSD